MLVHMAHQPDQSLGRAIAQVLREVRDQRGMSTRDIADYFGVADVTIGRWESGARQPALDLLPSFDRLAGQERGYVLRLAGYVTDQAATTGGFKINKSDPDEVKIWALEHMSEDIRKQLILQYREINTAPPPPPVRKKAPASRKRRRVS